MFLDDKQASDATVTEPEPWRKMLLDAADYLDTHGWCQGEASNGPRRCGRAALFEAAGCRADNPDYRRACTRLCEAIGLQIVPWNDTAGRTKEEVIAKLREVARA